MSHHKLRLVLAPLVGGLVCIAGFAGVIASCGGDDTPSGPAGGPVAGPQDMHCIQSDGGLITQSTSQADCQYRPPIDAPPLIDAGPDGPPVSDFGATMDNGSGNDDDCKYRVVWTATPIYDCLLEQGGKVFAIGVSLANGGVDIELIEGRVGRMCR